MGLNYAKNLVNSAVERSRYYTSMGGVDFSCDPSSISKGRFSLLENMYRDYDGEGAGFIESVPGFRIIARIADGVRKLYLQKNAKGEEYLLILGAKKLFRLPLSERDNPDKLEEIGTLPEGELVGFPYGDAFFFVGEGEMFHLDGDGILSRVGFETGEYAPYVPTTYKNGIRYEQRNLLSTRLRETTVLENPGDYTAESEGLLYEINDETRQTCTLTGRGEMTDDAIYVPSRVEIAGKMYRVNAVANQAFMDDNALREVHFSEGMETIGIFAFLRCSSLERVICSDSITTISPGAFNVCPSLSYVHFGEGLTNAKNDCFSLCDSLNTLHFSFSEATYETRFPADPFMAYEKVFLATNRYLCIDLPLYSHANDVLALYKDGEELSFSTLYKESGEVKCVRLPIEDARTFLGAELTLLATYQEAEGTFLSDALTDGNAPLKARVCELFDGRMFLGGCPKYPNTVFYTERDGSGMVNPTYFGVYNRFDDGIGSFSVNALLSVGNTLAVFKENDDGTGSIFYHSPKETSEGVISKIYPVSDIHSGLVGLGAVISYYDEPIFVSESGICALPRSNLDSERSVRVRSRRIYPRLLSEDLSKISLTKWCGYLVVCVGGKIFLGDYRQFSTDASGSEYEWYYLTGIGAYSGDKTVYRFHPKPAPYYALGLADQVTTSTVHSEIAPDGQKHYYVKPGPFKYEVYMTDEKRGGTFSPAKTVFSVGKLLFFATEDGTLCLFNNDKRGKAPLSRIFDGDEERLEYERFLGNRLHPSYYAFASHAPHYALSTKADNCDIPHLEKDSVRNSLTLKCRMEGASEATLLVRTDRDGYEEELSIRGGTLDFGEMDFSTFVFSSEAFETIACRGRVKKFVEKQISLVSDTFSSPIALSSIAYRYTIRGKIKNK